jgi:hypothetical protein
MVGIRIGAGIPIEHFPQMAQEMLDQASALTDSERTEAFERSLSHPYVPGVEGAPLIVHLLASNREDEAIAFAEKIAETIEENQAANAAMSWSQFLMCVLPPAIFLDYDAFAECLCKRNLKDPLQTASNFALCGQAYLAKKMYEKAASFLTESIEWAKEDPIMTTDLVYTQLATCLRALGRNSELAVVNAELRRQEDELEERHRLQELEQEHYRKQYEDELETERNAADPFEGTLNTNAQRAFRRWQLLLGGRKSDPPWEDYEHFTHAFCNCGPEDPIYAAILSDVPQGDEILLRLNEVSELVCERKLQAWQSEDGTTYSAWTNITNGTARKLAESYCANLIAINRNLGNFLPVLTTVPSMRIVRGTQRPVAQPDKFENLIFEMCDRSTQKLMESNEFAHALYEPISRMSQSYQLGRFILWPLLRSLQLADEGSSELNDPFLPYFELWKADARIHFQSTNQMLIYLPEG